MSQRSQGQLDEADGLADMRCGDVRYRHGRAGADRYNPVARQTLGFKVLRDRVGASLGELLVVIRRAGAIRVARGLDDGLVVLLEDQFDRVQDLVERRVDLNTNTQKKKKTKHVEGDVVPHARDTHAG